MSDFHKNYNDTKLVASIIGYNSEYQLVKVYQNRGSIIKVYSSGLTGF